MLMPRRLLGLYAAHLYLPLSDLARRRRGRGTAFGERRRHVTRLPVVSWRRCTRRRVVPLWEVAKTNGNVRLGELAVLAALAADCPHGADLFEIGTFDGRTTLNLALNAPAGCRIHTLDLPRDHATAYDVAPGERHMIDKPASGSRFHALRDRYSEQIGRIQQHFGDSASFDFSPYHGSCGLVFVDGSHVREYVLSDSANALRLVAQGGVVLWHDYGVWEDVTRALEGLDREKRLGLRHIRGTSLVILGQPASRDALGPICRPLAPPASRRIIPNL